MSNSEEKKSLDKGNNFIMFNESCSAMKVRPCKVGHFSIWPYREASGSVALLINVFVFQHRGESFNSLIESVWMDL